MQTTVLLIELLIIGGELALLLVAGYAWYLGVDPSALKIDRDAVTPVALGVAASFYPLGIIWSRVSDVVWSRLDSRARSQVFEGAESDRSYHQALVLVLARSAGVANGLAQVRSVYRIARATGTSCLIGSLMLLGAAHRLDFLSTRAEVISIVLLAALGTGSIQAWYHLRSHYLSYVAHASSVLGVADAQGPLPTLPEQEETGNG